MFPASLTQCSNEPWFIAYVAIVWMFGALIGYMIGRATKTRPYEIERDAARSDLNTLRDALDIVQKK